jgi:flagellar assembly protein FliH
MKSLSRIIKSSQYSSSLEKMVIQLNYELEKSPNFLDPENPQDLSESERNEQQRNQIVEHAKQEAAVMIRQAHEDVTRLKVEAENQIELWWNQRREEDEELYRQMKDDAFREGFAHGHEQGNTSAWEVQQKFIEEAKEVLEEAFRTKEKVIESAEPFLVKLSFEIAKKIVCEEISLKPDQILSIVRTAIAKVQEGEKVTICVHPEQFSFVQDKRSYLQTLLPSQTELIILPDYKIQNGGCIVRTSFGTIDATIDTQLETIRRVLLEAGKESENVHV